MKKRFILNSKKNTFEPLIKKSNYKLDILCISSTRWNYLWQRPQQIMSRLSKNNRVLFFDHSFPVDYLQIREKINNPQLWAKQLKKIHSNLWVFSAIHLHEGMKHYITNKNLSLKEYNYQIKEHALQYLIKKLNFKNPIIISNIPEATNYIKNIPNILLCYDCLDNYAAFTWADVDLLKQENKIIKKANIITCSATLLYEKIKKLNKNTFLLPNAADFEHFNKDYSPSNLFLSKKLNKNNKAVIGFIGAIYEWLDLDLLKHLITTRQDWLFLFIGPQQAGLKTNFLNKENVKSLGIKSYQELPQYLSLFDVCLIPFKVNEVTECANPIKMWEYMSAGKPIVSTPIPEAEKLKQIIYIAKDKYQFIDKIEKALDEKEKNIKTKRILMAKGNTWEHRAEELLNIINKSLGGDT